jgi:hypothetical protein
MNTVSVAGEEYCVLQADLLKRDLYNQSNRRDEPQFVFHAAPFLEERSFV